MRLFEFLHKYFGFNKRERNGIVILLAVILLLIFLRIFLPAGNNQPDISITRLEALQETRLDKDPGQKPAYSKGKKDPESTLSAARLFPFDPNTISVEEAKQLGFPDKLAATLDKFRSKGGKFRSKEDLQKLYGMKDALFASLEPYILIAALQQNQGSYSKEPFVKKGPAIIDLNRADSAEIVKLPMIGPGFTKRILKFRNALGGFCRVEQLKEVYGMQDSIYDKIKDRVSISTEVIRRINVNTATPDELKKHPYINYTIASALISYRSKHGLYKEAADLKQTGTISDELLEKLKPYLSF